MTEPKPPSFPTHDPATATFWDLRFEADFTPWDHGGVPRDLVSFVAQQSASLTTLIPGCGNAPEVCFLADAGWPVTAIDFSQAAITRAQTRFSAHQALIQHADFFSYQPPCPLDLIYERAFLCALPRARWTDWAHRMAELLATGGRLVGFFYIDDAQKGPPFGLAAGQLDELLTPFFSRELIRVPSDSNAVFAGKEYWMEWRRR